MTPHSSSMLEISSTEKGILIPRMTSAERIAIASPATGLLVYDTTLTKFSYYNGTTWTPIEGSGTSYWTLSGTNLYNNSGTNIGIGLTAPLAYLDITGNNIGSNALQLRSGNLSNATFSNQILFGYNNSANYRHAIKTRHQSGASQGNAIDFYTWNYGVDVSGTVGTKHLMTLDGTGYVGIGITTPLEKLHINGSARIDGGKLDFRNTGQSTFIGEYAGSNDDNTNNQNTALGAYSQFNTTSGYRNVSNGTNALYSNTIGYNNVAVGFNASLSNSSGYGNVAIGEGSLYFNQTGSENVAIGKLSGIANLGSGNIFIGNSAGANELGSNKLYIDNNNTLSPLIYGEFDSDLVRINGALNINNAYTLPTTSGTANSILQTNGAGLTSWVDPTSLSMNENDPQVSSSTANMVPKWNGTTLTDGIVFDNGTNIGIGTNLPTAKLHIVGNSIIDNGRLDFRNTGDSVFIGTEAGLNDDLSSNQNTFVGTSAGRDNTFGYSNTALGSGAMSTNISGSDNTYIGRMTGLGNTTGYFNTFLGSIAGFNSTGSSNIYIGYAAGMGQSGSNRLFIDNSNTSNPLVYGEFDTNLLRINGTLNVNNAYNLPTNSGAVNQILQTNGAGTSNWVDATSLTISESDPQVSSTTSNMVPKWNGTSLTDGIVYDNGTNIGIGTTSPGSRLEVQNAAAVDLNVKSTTSSSAVNVTSPNANDATFYINTLSGTNSLKRWGLGKANNNEAGSNAGSFFVLNRYDDSGNYLGQPMLINRTTGSMTIGNDNVSTADHTLKVNGSMSLKVATVVTSNNTTTLDGDDYSIIYGGTITGNSVVLPAANTCSGRVYLIINHSSSSVTISSYITANGTTSTAVANGLNLQIMSDGTNWHRIN